MNKTSVFKVAAGTDPNSLAEAIAGAIRNKETVSLQAIGAGPVNQANKAVIIARGFLAPIGIDLVIAPAFLDLNLDGQERTAIVLKLKQVE